MIPTRKIIELEQGVTAELLVTPALYGVASRRGMDLRPVSNEPADIISSYIRLVFCAAVNAWEVRAMDEPTIGEFPYTFSQFNDWAWGNQPEFGRVMNFAYTALTGKTIREGAQEEVKKKSRKR